MGFLFIDRSLQDRAHELELLLTLVQTVENAVERALVSLEDDYTLLGDRSGIIQLIAQHVAWVLVSGRQIERGRRIGEEHL